jgi:hypothetical protein
MSDLRERFKVLDDVRVPEAVTRARPSAPSVPRSPRSLRRVGTMLLALFVAASSFTLLTRAFDDSTPPPAPADTEAERLEVLPGSPIRVGDAPNAVAAGADGVWVSALPAEGEELRLVRLDPVTGEVVARIPVPTLPMWEVGGGGLVALPEAVWVTGGVDHAGASGCCDAFLYRVDPATNEVVEGIDLGPGFGADVWVDETGLWVLIFTEEERGPNIEVVRLDPISYEEVARIPLPTDWAKQVFAFDGSIWVHGNREDSTDAVRPDVLFRIDPITNTYVEAMALPSEEFALAVDDISVWQRLPKGVARVNPGVPAVEVELDGTEEHCCTHIASDGEGGLWVVARIERGRMRVVHLGPDGRVDGRGEADMSAVLDSVTMAFDREHRTFWLAQYREAVTPLRFTER